MRIAARRSYSTGTPRSVLVAGMRTPFVKAYGEFLHDDATALGSSCVSSLINKTNLDPNLLEAIVWGNVVLNTSNPNIGRDINIDLNLPRKIVAHQVSMACISGCRAISDADMMIRGGHSNCIIAGGSDSVSHAELPIPNDLTRGLAMTVYGGAKTPKGKLEQFWKHAGPIAKWLPGMPSVAEKSTGRTMGYHTDVTAEFNRISRQAQDEYAVESHRKTQIAKDKGVFDEEIAPFTTKSGKVVRYDNFLQKPNLEKMQKLKSAFRKPEDHGTITAANATGLTDGGSAVLMANEDFAKKQGWPTDMVLRAWHYSSVDPWPQLLIAPAVAIPAVLDKAGLTLQDMDIVEMHEAFAAQVLSTLHLINNKKFLDDLCGGHKPMGDIDPAKFNVNGGSLAIGHPFAGTGGRCTIAAMNELRRSKGRYALISVCAAGGIGATAVLERLDESSVQPSAASIGNK